MVKVEVSAEYGLVAHAGSACAAALSYGCSVKHNRFRHCKWRRSFDRSVRIDANRLDSQSIVQRKIQNMFAISRGCITKVDVFHILVFAVDRCPDVGVAGIQIHSALSKYVHVPHSGHTEILIADGQSRAVAPESD